MASFLAYILVLRDLLIGVGFVAIARLLPLLRPDRKDLTGKTAIVTGSNSGVGYGIALALAQQGATVVLACRNEAKAKQAKEEIISKHPAARVDIVLIDNSSFDSVRNFAKTCREKYDEIDILVQNAGISEPLKGQEISSDGFETMYQTNFLSSFLLTHLLESHLSKTARVIFTSSIASYVAYIDDKFALSKTTDRIERNFQANGFSTTGFANYAQGKLMQAAFAKALQSRFDSEPDSHRMAFSFEPGLVKTNIFAARPAPFLHDPMYWTFSRVMLYIGIDRDQGAATGVHLATSDSKTHVLANRGRYFDRMKVRKHMIDIMSREKLDRLWARWCADCAISWT